jgi:4-amino-4-deoxy-L-arabinose transferase-like glycosyltransferase
VRRVTLRAMSGASQRVGGQPPRARLAAGIVVAWSLLGLVSGGYRLTGGIAPRPEGLTARYYANAGWRGEPVVEELVPAPSLDAVERGSIPVSARHFSARFDGWLAIADPGRYQLRASFDDLLSVTIDGRRIVPPDGAEHERRAQVAVDLTHGAHEISVRYANLGADGRLELSLARSGHAWPWLLPPTYHPPGSRPRVGGADLALERLARSWPWISLAALGLVVALTWACQRKLAEALRDTLARRPAVGRALASATLHATVVAAMASAVFFTDLGAPPVARHDEDTHTRVALETADAGQWWPLVYHASAYARKPPLKLWLSAATFRWLGTSEGWVRVWDASFAVLTVLVTYGFARRVRGAGAGLVAAAVLVTCDGYVFHHAARDGVQDSAMILGFTLALALGSRSPLTPRLATGAALALVATSLTKPAMGLVPLAILVVHRLLSGPRRELVRAPFVAMTAAALAAPLAWQLAGWLSVPGFVEVSVGEQIVGRITGTSEPWHARPWWFYFPAQRVSLDGWWPVVPLALAAEVWRAARGRRQCDASPDGATATLLLLWPGVVFTAVSLVSLKLPWYAYPAYPAFAIAMGSLAVAAIDALRARLGARWPALAMLASVALAGFLAARVVDTVARARSRPMPLIVERFVAFLGEPERAGWRVIALGVDPALDFDDPTFYYLHRVGERIEHIASEEALAEALELDPGRPTLVIVSPRRPVPDALASRASARFTLPEPYGRVLPVLGFGAVDTARVPLLRS